MLRKFSVSTLAFGAVAAACLLYSAPSMAALTCTVQSIQSVVPKDTTITAADPTAAPVPHCKIEGFVTTTNPGPNKNNFRLQLPDKGWQGRFYFIGLGGAAGRVPTDSEIPGGNPLFQGFAVAGTDTGHTGHILDWGFLNTGDGPRVDHGLGRGAHMVAVATQAITKAYYDASKMYRYHSGCSGGGRMGMMTITHYAGDYDGVLVGAPGGTGSDTLFKFIHAYNQMIREPGSWLSPAKLAMVDKKVTEACDMTDGAKDGVVWDHRLCKFDVATLKCPAADGPDCLTAPEIKSIKEILIGARGPKGESLLPPMPITNMSVWASFLGAVPPPWSPEPSAENMPKSSAALVIATSMGKVYRGPEYDVRNFNFNSQKDLDDWHAAARKLSFGTPYDTDLRAVQKAGEKVILWNGRSDPCCSDVGMEEYYKDAVKISGAAEAAKFLALYQIPGMGHCGGGTGPGDAVDSLLSELMNWVEKGDAPRPVVSHRGADRIKQIFADPKTGKISSGISQPPVGGPRDFLLCRYPQYAKFNAALADKPGAVDDAANWSCVTPKPGDARQG